MNTPCRFTAASAAPTSFPKKLHELVSHAPADIVGFVEGVRVALAQNAQIFRDSYVP